MRRLTSPDECHENIIIIINHPQLTASRPGSPSPPPFTLLNIEYWIKAREVLLVLTLLQSLLHRMMSHLKQLYTENAHLCSQLIIQVNNTDRHIVLMKHIPNRAVASKTKPPTKIYRRGVRGGTKRWIRYDRRNSQIKTHMSTFVSHNNCDQ